MSVNCFFPERKRCYTGLAADTKPTPSTTPGAPIVSVGDEFWETDTGITYAWNGASWTGVRQVNGSGQLVLAAQAGARNLNSLTNSYVDVRDVSYRTILTAAGPTAIGGSVGANDVHLRGIHIRTALVGTLTITGFQDQAAAAQSEVLPIGTVGWIPYFDSLNDKGQLTIALSSATDYTTNKSVSAVWRAA